MPLGQFDERLIQIRSAAMNSSYVPGTGIQILPLQSGDWRADVIQLTNSDTVAHTVLISKNNNSTSLYGSVEVPAGSGYGAVPPVDAIAQLFPTNFHYMLSDADGFYVDTDAAPASGKQIGVWVQGGIF